MRFSESIFEEVPLALLGRAGWQFRNAADNVSGELRVKEAEHAIKETTA